MHTNKSVGHENYVGEDAVEKLFVDRFPKTI